MIPSKIEAGKTYRNKGAGRTTRAVLEIGDEGELGKPVWYSSNVRPNDRVVLFMMLDSGNKGILYLRSFAAWAGSEVDGGSQ